MTLRAAFLLPAALAACASYRLLPLSPPSGALAPVPVRYEKTKLLFFKSVEEDGALDRLFSAGPAMLATAARPEPGVYTSGDGGKSWTLARLPETGFTQVLFDPGDARRIFARAGASIWRSGDGGQTWAASAPGGGDPLDAMALGPGGALYAAVRGRLFVSADGGQAWKTLNPQISNPLWRARSILPDPEHAATVYLAVRVEQPEQKDLLTRFAALLELTSDEAVSALSLVDLHDASPRAVSWGGGDSVYVTHDGGALWTKTGLALDAWLAARQGALYAVAADPILRAASLMRRHPDLAFAAERQVRGDRADAASLRAACVYPGRDRLLAGPLSAALVFRSADTGATWSRIEEPPLPLMLALRAAVERQGEERPPPEARAPARTPSPRSAPPPDNPRSGGRYGGPRNPQPRAGAAPPAPQQPARTFSVETALSFVDPARLLAHFNAGLPLSGLSGGVAYLPTQAHWDALVAALASESREEGEISLGPAVPDWKDAFQLLRTGDGGASWTALGIALPPGYPRSMAASPEQILLVQEGRDRRAWRIAP